MSTYICICDCMKLLKISTQPNGKGLLGFLPPSLALKPKLTTSTAPDLTTKIDTNGQFLNFLTKIVIYRHYMPNKKAFR